MAGVLYPHPLPGKQMLPPLIPPQPGFVLLGYEEVPGEAKCCNMEGMTDTGRLIVIALIILFIFTLLPLFFIPCLVNDFYEKRQRPVYGPPPPGFDPNAAPKPEAYGYPPQQHVAMAPVATPYPPAPTPAPVAPEAAAVKV